MAATTTSTATETIFAKIITDQLIDAMYSVRVMDELCRQESLVGKPSNSYSFPIWPSLTAASIAETVDLASTAVDTTNVDIACTEASSIRIDVTDLLAESTVVRAASQFAAQGGKAVADKRDADLAALLSGFSTVKGVDSASLSEANMLDSYTALQAADAPAPYVAVLQPVSVGHLRKAVANTSTINFHFTPDQMGGSPGNGFQFSYYGIDVYSTTNVPSMGTTGYGNAMFAKGQALARVDKRPIRVEPQRDASLRAWEFNLTSVYGQGELVDGWGVTINTDSAAL